MSSAVLGIACLGLGPLVHDNEMQAMTFFSSGALLLTVAPDCSDVRMNVVEVGAKSQKL